MNETINENSEIHNWILNRNGFFSELEFKKWLCSKKRILDAGCGNGRIIVLFKKYISEHINIVGIDLVSADIAKKNTVNFDGVDIFTANLLDDLSIYGKFDLIYCQEVLHHTSDPKKAFFNLCNLLEDDGEIAIYIYKMKGPIREYTDEYIRSNISILPYNQAFDEMKLITMLGKILSEINIKIKVPSIPLLGIESGVYDIQRFIYNYFIKCFWSNSLSFEDNVAINYDWYHPKICYKYKINEVVSWFNEAGIEIIHSNVDYYGITIRGVKRSH